VSWQPLRPSYRLSRLSASTCPMGGYYRTINTSIYLSTGSHAPSDRHHTMPKLVLFITTFAIASTIATALSSLWLLSVSATALLLPLGNARTSLLKAPRRSLSSSMRASSHHLYRSACYHVKPLLQRQARRPKMRHLSRNCAMRRLKALSRRQPKAAKPL
jgi:hypothetical protein